jgi:hypothetical protein
VASGAATDVVESSLEAGRRISTRSRVVYAGASFIGAMRKAAGLAAALISRASDIVKIETQVTLPRIANFALR